ncbi:MAG: DUF1877 family protein [Myxococcota bacterium]
MPVVARHSTRPLSYAVLGGAALDAGEDYTACLTTPEQVAEVAEALRRTDASWFRSRFESLSRTNTEFSAKGDFEYVWSNLDGLRGSMARLRGGRRPCCEFFNVLLGQHFW